MSFCYPLSLKYVFPWSQLWTLSKCISCIRAMTDSAWQFQIVVAWLCVWGIPKWLKEHRHWHSPAPPLPWSDPHPNYNPCPCITFGSPLPLSMEDLELKSADDICRQVTFGVISFCSVLELCIHNTQVTFIPSLFQAWHCAWSSVTLQIQKTLGTRATLEFYLF